MYVTHFSAQVASQLIHEIIHCAALGLCSTHNMTPSLQPVTSPLLQAGKKDILISLIAFALFIPLPEGRRTGLPDHNTRRTAKDWHIDTTNKKA